jgi:hypothetical protein
MATGASAAPRRRWHPVAVAGGLAVVAFGAAGAGFAAADPGWILLVGWLLAGTAAGFATSGST